MRDVDRVINRVRYVLHKVNTFADLRVALLAIDLIMVDEGIADECCIPDHDVDGAPAIRLAAASVNAEVSS